MDIAENYAVAPIFFIESDWEHCLSETYGKVWISCKFKDCDGNYGKITRLCEGKNGSASNLKTTGGFDVDLFSSNALCIIYNSNYKCTFIAPLNIYCDIHKKSVTCLSANETSMCTSVSMDSKGEILVWSKENGQTLLTLKGHVGDVYKCKWLPSNKVILTAGSDMCLKIWCAETGRCPVTLMGHTRAITDICIVDRGRNVISVSKDGICKLWDCGQSCCLADLIKVSCSINCCAISVTPSDVELPPCTVISNEREIGTENKILLFGCDDGNVICLAVRSRAVLFTVTLDSIPSCCCAVNDGLFAVGCRSGKTVLIDAAQRCVVSHWFETNSCVLSVASYKQVGFFSGHMDGSCVFRSIIDPNSTVRLQLSGPQDDPVYDISFDNRYVYTACRDSSIRRYFPQPYIKKYFKI